MTRKTRNPLPDPRPESKGPRGRRARNPGVPGDSFYDSVFSGAANEDRVRAQGLNSLDSEIGILRLRLKGLLYQEYEHRRIRNSDEDSNEDSKKDNTPLILKTLDLIVRAYAAKIRAFKDSPDADDEAIGNMIKDAADNFGLKILPWDSNC